MSTVVRTLAQVLADNDAAAPEARGFFYDEPRLRACLPDHDQVLYLAERDASPPRTVTGPDGLPLTWRLDRVTYPAGDLPTDELRRSIGHWNPPGQSEIFEVERGEVAVLTALSVDGPVELVRCPEGSIVCLRLGAWHLTYVLSGPAVVANIYTEQERRGPGKYFTRPTVRAGLRRENGTATPFTGAPGPQIEWRPACGGRDIIGDAAGLAAMLTAPAAADLLIDPQRHWKVAVPAGPGGARSQLGE